MTKAPCRMKTSVNDLEERTANFNESVIEFSSLYRLLP